jgi:hypothetical protein
MVDKPFGGRTATFVLTAACLTTGLVRALAALGAGSVFARVVRTGFLPQSDFSPDRRLARPLPAGRPLDPEAAAGVTADEPPRLRVGVVAIDEVRGAIFLLPPFGPDAESFSGATSSNLAAVGHQQARP